ncbi:hypothetical protein [Baaleninema sp.]|uniref:hypothetical protein n=1 Tax=Baaleninema sp. TaxID=3101197 RepID=UPI003D089E96
MLSPISPIPGAISEIMASVARNGHLTLADRYGLLAATLDESTNDIERLAIDRLLRAVARGKIKVVNRISALYF